MISGSSYEIEYPGQIQGSHSTLKTRENYGSFSSHGNIVEFLKFKKYGQIRKNLEN